MSGTLIIKELLWVSYRLDLIWDNSVNGVKYNIKLSYKTYKKLSFYWKAEQKVLMIPEKSEDWFDTC